jgi:type IV pilus assembly protein PilB
MLTNLTNILEQKGVLDASVAKEVQEQSQETGKPVEAILKSRGISDRAILEAKGEYWNIPIRELGDKPAPYEVLQHIPEESAKHYQVVPLGLVDNVLEVGIVDPDNIDALDALNFISTQQGVPFKVFLINESDYARVIQTYQGVSSEVGKALKALGDDDEKEGDSSTSRMSSDQEPTNLDDLEAKVTQAGKKGGGVDIHEEAPVTKIVATILRSAIEERASDIHIEPQREQTRVRYRIDGVLQQSLVLPVKVQQAVVARIKILSSIKLDEKRKPQDGRFSATINGRRVDFRVSTMPTYFGEKVVLRILDSERSAITLEDLGMNPDQLAVSRKAVDAPYGMILITGPTGSGKSTTLYAMLNEVDKDGMNVLSLEDPVEYNMDGVSQSQMRPEIGYTFASGIRSVLRQDPDIIMVGEIRDKETAQLAVQAALTGHLVLSTLHTNNAAGAVPRLIDMGVDPYLLAPTLILIVAQRLARRICPDSGKPLPIEGSIKAMLDEQFADLPIEYRRKLPPAKEFLSLEPSPTCPTGTRGRLGVYEMLEVTDDIQQAILKGADEAIIQSLARKHGMLTLKEDAIRKAMDKQLPFEEIARVSGAIETESHEETEAKPETEAGAVKDVPAEASIENERDLV